MLHWKNPCGTIARWRGEAYVMVLWSWLIFTFGNGCCCRISLRLFKWLKDLIWFKMCWLGAWWVWLLDDLKNTASLLSSLVFVFWWLVEGWLSKEDKLFELPLEFDEEVIGPCRPLVGMFCCVDLFVIGWSLNVFCTAVWWNY